MKSCKFSGGYDEMVTPVPIPNTEVKHLSADNTWLETARESKSLPDLYSSLAQSVERVTVNHDVAGSSPAGGAKKATNYSSLLFLWCDVCTA